MPFQVLRTLGDELFEFVVVDPNALLEGYTCVLRDEDADSLRLDSVGDALILNIVAIHSHDPQHVTVNLVGPIIVNRTTLMGQQVILANSGDWSTEHVLVDSVQGNGRTGSVGLGERRNLFYVSSEQTGRGEHYDRG
jgi:flagellar assembly factor FliW